MYLAQSDFHYVTFILISMCMTGGKERYVHIFFFYGIQEWLKSLGKSLSVIISVFNCHFNTWTFARIILLKHVMYQLKILKHPWNCNRNCQTWFLAKAKDSHLVPFNKCALSIKFMNRCLKQLSLAIKSKYSQVIRDMILNTTNFPPSYYILL